MAKSIWAILNVPASSDERAIKRAYATLLRANNPEDDPAGFQVLRGAYEQALQYAKYAKDYPEDAYYDAWEDEDEGEVELSLGSQPEQQPAQIEEATDLPPHPMASDIDDVEAFENCSPPPIQSPPVQTPPPQTPPVQNQARQRPFDELTPEQHDHQKKLLALDQAIKRGAFNGELKAALLAVTNAPAMIDIGIYTQTEQHILNLIAHDSAASRSICDSAFQAFGWDKAENQGRGSVGEQAVWVRDRWANEKESDAFLERVKNPKHEFYPAWKEASVDPSTRSALSKIIGIRHLPVVQRFFNTMYAKAPAAFNGLNDYAVDWLNNRLLTHLPKFRFIKWAFVGLVVLGVVASLMLDSPPPSGQSSKLVPPPGTSTEAVSPAQARAKCLKQTKSVPVYQGGDESKSSSFMRFIATEACEAALVQRPNSLVLQTSLGVINLKKRYFGPAAENFQKVLDVSPNDDIALYGLALAQTRLGNENAMAIGASLAKRSSPLAKKYFDELGLAYDILDETGALVTLDERTVAGSKFNGIGARIIAPEEFNKSAQYYGISQLPTNGYVEVACSANSKPVPCTIIQEIPTGQGLGEVAIHAAQNLPLPDTIQADDLVPSKFVFELKR